MTRAAVSLGVAAMCLGGYAALLVAAGQAAPQTGDVAIDADDVGGVVSGPRGPEAGVWVIAETTELPTRFNKIVVTDDLGRYVLPDLPKAIVRRVGSRIRPGGFRQGQGLSRPACEPDRQVRADAAGRRSVLSRPATGTR